MTQLARRLGDGLSWAIAGVAALALGLLLAVAVPAPASAAQTFEVSFAFGPIAPGQPFTQTSTYHLAHDARFAEVEWISRTGLFEDADFRVEVCEGADATCADPRELTAGALEAGELTVAVTVSVSDEALITEGGDAAGRLTFVADEGDLAVTGADVASALLWSSGLLLVGAALLLLASRRTQPETD
jgi:hypothetical protein